MSQDRSRDRSRRDRNNRDSPSRDRSTDRGGRDRSSKASSSRVYVSNIPYEYRWQDIKDLFRENVGEVSFVEMFVDDNDKPKGVCIVEFADQSSVKKCLEVMQRFEVRGRKIVIKEDSGNPRDKHGNILGRGGERRSRRDEGNRYREDRDRLNGSSVDMSVSDNKWNQTFGLSPQFLESLHIDPPLTNRVFVANLDYNADKKKLKEVFRLAGRVIKVDVSYDKDGRSRGFAVIEYDHPVEAVQAISMFHNQVYMDRQLTVRLDRVSEAMKLPEGLKSIGMGLGQNGEPLKNVAYNLPNMTGGGGSNGGTAAAVNANQGLMGSGLLGAVPGANALQVANALTSLTNAGLGGLNLSSLTGLTSNLLQNGLGNATPDLSLLAQTQQLSALQGAAGGANMGNAGNLGNAAALTGGLTPLGGTGSGSSLVQSQGSFRSGGSDSYNPNAPVTYPTNYGGAQRSSSTFGGLDIRSSMRPLGGGGDSKQTSRKILLSNLPPTAPFKLLQEKLNEFGEVSYWEEKGTGSYLVVYGNEWQAERAIKNLDKARIDGRYIEARLYM